MTKPTSAASPSSGIDHEHLRRMKIKLLITRDQWKELKAHMYWTAMIFSGVISLALLTQKSFQYSINFPLIEIINYSHFMSSLMSFSMIFILYSSQLFSSRLSSLISSLSFIQIIFTILCYILSLTHIDETIQPLQEYVRHSLSYFFVSSEIDFFCGQLNGNLPIGSLVYWIIYIFSAYMENNYRNILKTLNEFEEMEKLLVQVEKKGERKGEKKEEKGKEEKEEEEEVKEENEKERISKKKNKKKKTS